MLAVLAFWQRARVERCRLRVASRRPEPRHRAGVGFTGRCGERFDGGDDRTTTPLLATADSIAPSRFCKGEGRVKLRPSLRCSASPARRHLRPLGPEPPAGMGALIVQVLPAGGRHAPRAPDARPNRLLDAPPFHRPRGARHVQELAGDGAIFATGRHSIPCTSPPGRTPGRRRVLRRRHRLTVNQHAGEILTQQVGLRRSPRRETETPPAERSV
jgi:hypothetical protein